MKPLIQAVNLSKRFGTLSALRNISLDIFPGEVLGIFGQSGSGKSTLAMMLAGIYPADKGQIFLDGKQLNPPFHNRSLGIEFIHQTPKLAENLDITSNIFLGNEIGLPISNKWLRIPDMLRMDQKAAEILNDLGVKYPSLREKVYNLSGEKRQMIAIAQVMTTHPRLVIIDDPTQLLSYPYQQKLLSLILRWHQQGTAVLFVGSNLDQMLSVTDRIIVLRKGYRAAEYQTEKAEREEIIAAMVGTKDYQKLLPIIWAMDSYYQERQQAGNLQRGQIILDRDISAQESVRGQLIDQLTAQITSLDSINQTLKNAQRRLLKDLEQERKHLAREIHDQIIQDLLSTNYQLEEIESNKNITNTSKTDLVNVRDNIRDMIDELRNICRNLRPPTLDSLGLNSALQSFSSDWSKRTEIPVTLDLEKNLERLPEDIELSIYRIVQEGLNNIQKHAEATEVYISLKHTSPRALMISISDNGKGMDKNFDVVSLPTNNHFGLLGISERVVLLGGRLRIQNKAEGGLLIQAEIPLPKNNLSSI